MKKIFTGIILALLFLVNGAALADDTPAPAAASSAAASKGPQDNPAFIQFQQDGGRIESLGNTLGVDGWVLVDKDNKVVTAIYSTPQGGLIKGWLFDPEGKALTVTQIAGYRARMMGAQGAVPGADKGGASKAENLYALLEKSNWVRAGAKDAPYLYLLINVTCDHCQALFKKLLPSVKAGTLQVRIIPFGKMEENRQLGAALLSADNPQEAWEKFIAGDKEVLAQDKIKAGNLDRLDENTRLYFRWMSFEPPFVMYRKLTDGVVTAIVGEPDNMMMVQADLMKNNATSKN